MADDEIGARNPDTGDSGGGPDLPESVVAEATELTRRARRANDPNEAAAYRRAREDLLEPHGYTARVREEDRAVLVCYPGEWVEDGTVRPEHIEDTDRGVARAREGPGDPDDWKEIYAHNERIADAIESDHGPAHGANAHAFATFLSNHYAKRIEAVTDAEREEFLAEYFPRNAWPTDDQKAVVEESVRRVVERARRQ